MKLNVWVAETTNMRMECQMQKTILVNDQLMKDTLKTRRDEKIDPKVIEDSKKTNISVIGIYTILIKN